MSAISITKGSIKLAAPGVVVIHPAGGVKEQTTSVYAKWLSERGYVAVAYDAAHQGDSEGLPRYLEDAAARTTDASAVADYLQRLDYVDTNRIFIVGVCAGGGYAVAAAKVDHRFKAVAIVSPVNMGDGTRLGMDGKGDPAQSVATLNQVALAMQSEASSNEPIIVPYIVPKGEAPVRDTHDTHEYYFTSRGQHPNSQNKMLLRSVPLLMAWDAWQYADIFLTQPMLMVYGEESTNRWHADKLFEKLDGKHKALNRIVVPNAYHFDFYDKPAFVGPAVEEMDKMFRAV